ncbi:MAG: hypothetical protein D6727_02570 [Gammaproteobacteria bacterium]|nr:MAG: hypothetical protein D6727_02570 [Gammaproteobacteria bacterium]
MPQHIALAGGDQLFVQGHEAGIAVVRAEHDLPEQQVARRAAPVVDDAVKADRGHPLIAAEARVDRRVLRALAVPRNEYGGVAERLQQVDPGLQIQCRVLEQHRAAAAVGPGVAAVQRQHREAALGAPEPPGLGHAELEAAHRAVADQHGQVARALRRGFTGRQVQSAVQRQAVMGPQPHADDRHVVAGAAVAEQIGRVSAGTAVAAVVACGAEADRGRIVADQDVVTGLTEQPVAAGFAEQVVVAIAAADRVVAAAAGDAVIAGQADDHVVAGRAGEFVVGGCADQGRGQAVAGLRRQLQRRETGQGGDEPEQVAIHADGAEWAIVRGGRRPRPRILPSIVPARGRHGKRAAGHCAGGPLAGQALSDYKDRQAPDSGPAEQ